MHTKMSKSTDDYLWLSGISHFRFCKRQWALIHIEQQWEENALTAEGHIMHERVHDSGFTEKRGRIILSRGMPVRSDRLKINGVCDMVELICDDETGVPIFGRDGLYRINPVEYKHGNDRYDESAAFQLCAQVLCLEEMFVTDIPTADIYYGRLHARKTYEMTPELRKDVEEALAEMNSYMARGYTPKVKPKKECKSCSMYEICRPDLTKCGSAKEYVKEVLSDE